MAWVSRIILGVLLIIFGLGYAVLRVLADIDGDPNEGPLGGWAPLIAGVTLAALGAIVLIF